MTIKSKGKNDKGKTVHILMGLFFFVNLCVGNGFLSVPYAFVYSGYLTAVPTLVFITFMSWVSSNYILEVMARAQALEYMKKANEAIVNASDSESAEQEILHKWMLPAKEPDHDYSNYNHPKFEITLQRKFEIPDLCQMFFNRFVKYVYLLAQSAFCFLICWTYATVAGTAWATNIPFQYLGALQRCSDHAFLHRILPTGDCLYAYYLSLGLFAVIVVTISLLDLKEQAFFQLSFGLMRFFTIAAAVIYCITRLIHGGDVCLDYGNDINYTLHTPTNIDIYSVLIKFDTRGWLQSIPIFIVANQFQIGIPSLSHPIRQKEYLHWLILAMIIIAFISYLSLGIGVSLWFRASIQETCTLNWATFTKPEYSLLLRIFSYYLIFFPSLDVISTFTLVVHITVNSVYTIITGDAVSEKPKYKHDLFLKLFLRFCLACLPIGAAFGVANLVYVLKFAGFLGLVCYITPYFLQVRSIQVCKKNFSKFHISVPSSHPLKRITSNKVHSEREDHLLLASDNISKNKLYMTPYSYSFISHLVTGWIMVALGICFILVTLTNLFVSPRKLSCGNTFEDQEL